MYFLFFPSTGRPRCSSSGILTANVCSRAFGRSPKIPHGILRLHNEASRSRRTRETEETFRGSASCFSPNVGALEKDAAFRTDIFESKVLQWRSEASFPGSSHRPTTTPASSLAVSARGKYIGAASSSRRYSAWLYTSRGKYRAAKGSATWAFPRDDPTLLPRPLISGTREPPSSSKLCARGLALSYLLRRRASFRAL